MGWMWTNKSKLVGVAAFLKQEFAYENEAARHTVLDVAVVQLTTAYCACELVSKVTGERRVYALAVKLAYAPNQVDNNFGYKDLDEANGLLDYDCPARILDLLTETDNATANQWRQQCRARQAGLARFVRLQVGDAFSNGTHQYTLKAINRRTGYLTEDETGRQTHFPGNKLRRMFLNGAVKLVA